MKPVKWFVPLFVLFLSVLISGCINYEQKTVLNSDGSGTMKIHYWAKSNNIMGDEISGFGFTEDKAREKFSSSNTQVSDVKIEEKKEDSTKHVYLDLKFKDINKLTDAKGFSKIKASWQKGKEGMEFIYTLLKDTANSGFGMKDYKLIYEFEFPNEILSSNGKIEGKKVTWNKTLADLNQDVELKAVVKSEKKCGIFGIELPIIILAGLIIRYRLRYRK